jgi:hypothetical protein
MQSPICGDVEQRVALVDDRQVGAADDDAGGFAFHRRLERAERVGYHAKLITCGDEFTGALERPQQSTRRRPKPGAREDLQRSFPRL